MPTTCMICQKTGRMCYNVFTDYGSINHTIRDDMVEIFGVDVEPYLSPKDFLCGMCTAMLENIAKLKRRLWPLICHHNQNCKPISLGRIWDIFASLKFDDHSDEEDNIIPCRTPTPSKLLTLNYSKAYNDRLENEIANIERYRSLSRASSGFGRSDVSETSEVRNILSKKRKKRNGHKNWTRHKRQARSPATSEFSTRSYSTARHSRLSDFERTVSPLSDCSYVSSYTVKKTPVKKRRVEYDQEGRLVRKRTRSISRAQEEEAKYLEMLDNSKHYCGEKDCLLYFEDVDVLNHHRMKHHQLMALHFCDECSQKYTTAEHLKLHMKIHDVYPFLCPLCACDVKNQEALQEHLEEHMTYSVPCKYCDKSFLNRKLCEAHHKSTHTGRRERIIHREKIIIARLDKDQQTYGDRKDNSDAQRSSRDVYSVHILPYTDMEYNSGDLDVTEENIKGAGMDFIVDQEEESVNDNDESELLSEPPSQSNIEEEVIWDSVVEKDV